MSGSTARFLDTRGNKTTLGIGVCDRCGTKRSLSEFMADPNASGLKVCRDPAEGCIDKYDPYRMPSRSPDPITLPFYRPDVSLDSGPDVTDWLRDDSIAYAFRITLNGRGRLTSQGALRTVRYTPQPPTPPTPPLPGVGLALATTEDGRATTSEGGTLLVVKVEKFDG